MNPECQIHVNPNIVVDDLLNILSNHYGEHFRVNKKYSFVYELDKLSVYIDEPDEYDPEKAKITDTGFLYYQYILEVDPVGSIEFDEYVAAINHLLEFLKSCNISFTAACEYEEMLLEPYVATSN